MSIFDLISAFFSDVSEFLHHGVYDLLQSWFAKLAIWLLIAYIKAKIYTLTFVWNIAQEVIAGLDISSYLNSAWSSMDSKVLALITYVRIPEAINMICSALLTRYILMLIGW